MNFSYSNLTGKMEDVRDKSFGVDQYHRNLPYIRLHQSGEFSSYTDLRDLPVY